LSVKPGVKVYWKTIKYSSFSVYGWPVLDNKDCLMGWARRSPSD